MGLLMDSQADESDWSAMQNRARLQTDELNTYFESIVFALPSLIHSARQKAEEVPPMQRDQNLTKMAYHLHPKETPMALGKQATRLTNVIRTITCLFQWLCQWHFASFIQQWRESVWQHSLGEELQSLKSGGHRQPTIHPISRMLVLVMKFLMGAIMVAA
jgi:hypothetical protein